MKKRIVRVFALILVLSLVGVSQVVQAATKDSIVPYFDTTSNVYAKVIVSNYGYANCYGKLTIYSGFSADVTLTLQKSSDGVNWSENKTWTTSGSGTLSIDQNRFVPSGYQYRLYLKAEVYNAKGVLTETVTCTSEIVTY